MNAPDWRENFNRAFGPGWLPEQEDNWRAVLGDDYPEGVEPFSFTSRSELERMATLLQVEHGSLLADVGCGRGGPGMWLARRCGTDLIGIDISNTALEQARSRINQFGLLGHARFLQGSFDATGLEEASANAVLSIDALTFAPDKAAACREVARVLRPGGRFVFTSWDYDRQPEDRPPQVEDHRPLLQHAGFEVEVYDETPRWRELQRGITLHQRAAIEARVKAGESEAAATLLALDRQLELTDMMRRRVLAVGLRLSARSTLP